MDYDTYGTPTLCPVGHLNGDGFAHDGDFPAFSTNYDVPHCKDAAMPGGAKGNSCPADPNEDGCVD